MKYVAIALLLINVGALVWATTLRQPSAPPPQITRSFDSDIGSLELVSEVDASRQEALNLVINNPIRDRASAPEAGEEALRCLAIGPFSTVFEAEAMLQQAAALDMAAVMRAIDETTGDTDYRVLIPPHSSVEEAFRKLRELKSLGIDSYIITQGPQAMGISLGVFSTPEAAQSLREERERQGYGAVIDELPQVARQFWVFDIQPSATDARREVWRQLLPPDSPLALTTEACPDE